MKKDVAILSNYAEEKLQETTELSEVMNTVPSIIQRGGIYLISAALGFSTILLYFGKIPVWVNAKGYVVPEVENMTVLAEENGVVTEVFAEVGQRLPEGTTLLKIKPEDSNINSISTTEELKTLQNLREQELEIIKHKLEVARLEMQSTSQSDTNKKQDREISNKHRDKIVNLEKQIESITTKIAQINKPINYPNTSIGDTHITMPQEGKIVELEVKNRGELVSKGTLLAKVIPADNSFMVRANISEKDIIFIKPNMEAKVKINAYNYHEFGSIPAKVKNFIPDLEQQGNYIVTLELLENHRDKNQNKISEMTLLQGLNVQVEIPTKEQRLYKLLFSK